MAKKCNCLHDPELRRNIIRMTGTYYHEHRCECPCGCKRDSLGYLYCSCCYWDLIEGKGKHAQFKAKTGQIGPLLYPIISESK